MKFLLGITLGLALFPLIGDVFKLIEYKTDKDMPFIIPTYNAFEGVVGRCTKDVSQNGHGWTFIRRDFFGCGKINIMISDLLHGDYLDLKKSNELNMKLFKKNCSSRNKDHGGPFYDRCDVNPCDVNCYDPRVLYGDRI